MKNKHLSGESKIGIINRGEAAARFIGAVREYNLIHSTQIEAVAFYIEPERDALFAKMADHAYPLAQFKGFSEISGSPYLDVEFLIAALKKTSCQAVWVGWGFLAEDPIFVEALEREGIILLGPSSKSMAALGDKIQAKELAHKADVPTCPWSKRPLEDLDDAKKVALEIGYPVILKAANGGGGRGIRKVMTPDDMEEQFKSVSDEIFRFFGNRVIFLEALVVRGRHLEVQTVADEYGNVLAFGVRDCSVQRNNQKIIEETPPAKLDQETIERMEAASKRLLKVAEYKGAATVEFLYDLDRKSPFFMEVNTRLQVEHPITENLYSIDLIMLQIKVAFGQNLSDFQIPQPRGHVIELRLNAEDPENKFAPTPGKVLRFKPPCGPGIRVDTGIEEGSTIPREFDSMIAKIIAQAPTRELTVARLKRALKDLKVEIEKGTTNKAFLIELLNQPEVVEGGVQTSFVEKYLQDQTLGVLRSHWEVALTSAAIYQYRQKYFEAIDAFTTKIKRFSAPRGFADLAGEYTLSYEGEKFTFHLRSLGRGFYHIGYKGEHLVVKYTQSGADIIVLVGGKRYQVQIVPRSGFIQCEVDGISYPIEVGAAGSIVAPSPSVVLTVDCEAGKQVKKGDRLMTLEAMKMEMIVAAPEDGVVSSVLVLPGEQVAAGQSLVDVEVAEDTNNCSQKPTLQLSFANMTLSDHPKTEIEIEDTWYYLRREYLAHFLGHDAIEDNGLFGKLENFVEKHPEYRRKLCDLMLLGIRSFVAIEELYSGKQLFLDESKRELAFEDLMVHYLLRKGEAEDVIPQAFQSRLENAFQWYSGVEFNDYESIARVLFHINQSHVNLRNKVGFVRHALAVLQKNYPLVPEVMDKGDLADLLNALVAADVGDSSLVDHAFNTRYELVSRFVLEQIDKERHDLVANFLDKLLKSKGSEEQDKMIQEIVDSGHQIVDYLMSIYQKGSDDEHILLELMGRRYNRDRNLLESSVVTVENHKLCDQLLKKKSGLSRYYIGVLSTDDYLKPLDWLAKYLDAADVEEKEVLLLLPGVKEDDVDHLAEHMFDQRIDCTSVCLGLNVDGTTRYKTFVPEGMGFRESQKRHSFSPLRYRELRVDRMDNFNMRLVYHSGLVHLMLGTAKDNPKDERLFAFVEIPECKVILDEEGFIRRVVGFEDNVLDAVQAIHREQARRKRRLHWNRIIVHIGEVHPLKLEQIGQYPRLLTGMIHGIGLEKIVIYTKIVGRRYPSIDSEVLFEQLATKPTLRGRRPSNHLLQPLDQYNSKVLRCLQRGVTYPYETINMITSNEDFPQGQFVEYDIDVKDGEARLVLMNHRSYGKNSSNIVFGLISNYIGHIEAKRVIILGDPSKDLGSLAEQECRRVMAAIDLAEEERLPVEWVPLSSGAAIGMDTGTENLDWTAKVLRRIIEFTQNGGEINIIVSGINVGAQSYWNAEATMMMHNSGVLIMTEKGSMLLTGKKALDFSGSVSADDNIGIGGGEKIMGLNGQAQFLVKDLAEAYQLLFRHYQLTYSRQGDGVARVGTSDPANRNVCEHPYQDPLGQGFTKVGDILGHDNAERKKPFDMRQIMGSVKDHDADHLERWAVYREAESTIVWETRVGGIATCMLGIESRPLPRLGEIANDGPDSWNGGTLYPQSSRKIARAINAYSGKVPVVVLANLSGFDGSPESLRNWQLEYGAEIGRAVVNFKGPIVFAVISRYHGGAYVVFSKALNENMTAIALEKTYASVIGGAPAAAVVFPRQVMKRTIEDPEMIKADDELKEGKIDKATYKETLLRLKLEHQAKVAQEFEMVHTVERAKEVGSIDHIISAAELRSFVISTLEKRIH